MTLKYARCNGGLWICETHEAQGMPCADCNASDNTRDQPKMPPGFIIDADHDGARR
jgi:hypothetical protein